MPSKKTVPDTVIGIDAKNGRYLKETDSVMVLLRPVELGLYE